MEDRFYCHRLDWGRLRRIRWSFHPKRRWRADVAHLESRSLIEIEGGIWVNGRHNRAAGFNADLEKYLEASLGGWRVFRLGPDQITLPVVKRLAGILRHCS